MDSFRLSPLLLGFTLLFLLIQPAHAFGAGNIASISQVEGVNWRHGDIEDTLLQLFMARAVGGNKFDKLMVSRVYFGNWLRDYSQAIDVGTVKAVSAEAIRLLLSILGFLTFGYGSREFEVTAERLGTYRPEDHIDNPKGYADNLDARRYDPRLRGPIDERVELAIDAGTGMKNYIANERLSIMTSALHVRKLFTGCIELGRRYNHHKQKVDLYEAMRLMGTGLHCLEDFLAHSNYLELALIELGERDVFPHVGRNTVIRLPGGQGAQHSVYPIVTGTFGGVDFLHSVVGELDDKMTQNELQGLQGTLQNSQFGDASILRSLLDKIPDSIFGGDDKKAKMNQLQENATTAQMQQMNVSPRQPEQFTRYVQNIYHQIMPAIEFHDEIIQSIREMIEKIPILPQLVEQLEDQLSIFVFSIIAPFVVPVIDQVKNELQTGSEEVIQSSKNEQFIVFDDDNCTDPTHSMLSKDHFSNILNEIAGKTASKVVAWVVPQIMEAWDNDRVDVGRTVNRIIHGVMHHPVQRAMGEDGARDGREIMFRSVEQWWAEMDQEEKAAYRRKLSREGVQNDENHKEGVHDTGHGCGQPLGMHKQFGSSRDVGGGSMQQQLIGEVAGAIFGGGKSEAGGGGGGSGSGSGGGILGGLLGAVAGGLGGSLLGEGFKPSQTQTYASRRYNENGGVTETTAEYGHAGNRYGQAQYTEIEYPGGGNRSEYQRYEQEQQGSGGYGRQPDYGSAYTERQETRPMHGGGFEQREERTWRNNQGGSFRQEERFEEQPEYGGGRGRREEYGESYESRRGNEYEEQRRREQQYEEQRRREQQFGEERRQEEQRRREEQYAEQRQQEERYAERRREEEYAEQRRRPEYEERYEERPSGWGGGRRGENLSGGVYDERPSGWGGGERREEFEDQSRGGGGGGGGGGLFEELAEEVEEVLEGEGEGRRGGGGGWGF